jgi:hypothetical protein
MLKRQRKRHVRGGVLCASLESQNVCCKLRQPQKQVTCEILDIRHGVIEFFAVLCYCCVSWLVTDVSGERIGRVFKCEDVQGKNWRLLTFEEKTVTLFCSVSGKTAYAAITPKKRRSQLFRTLNVQNKKLLQGFVTIKTVQLLAQGA